MIKYLIFTFLDVVFSIFATTYFLEKINAKKYKVIYISAFVITLTSATLVLIYNNIVYTQNSIELMVDLTIIPVLVILLIVQMLENIKKLPN